MTARRSIVKPALAIAFAGLFAIAFTFLLNAILGLYSPSLFQDRARQAIAEGTMVARTPLPFANDDGPFRYDGNDCLILAMLAARRPGDIISPRQPAVETPPEWFPPSFYEARAEPSEVSRARGTIRHQMCFQLTQAANSEVDSRPYHRYVHLYVPLAGLGVAALGFAGYTWLLHSLALFIPLILIGLAVRRGDRRSLAFAALGIAYLALSGVWRFSWNAALGPAEILLSAVLLASFLRPERGAYFYAVAGALAAALDFLTGLIPSLLVLILGIAAIEGRSFRTAVGQASIAAAAAIATLLFKAAIVAIVFGPAGLSDSVALLTQHASVAGLESYQGLASVFDRLGLDPALVDNRIGFVAIAFAKFAFFADLIAWGSRPLGALIVLAGPALLFALSLWLLWQRRPAGLIFLAALGGVLSWVVIFPEHSVAHALWMQRLPAWLTIILVGYAALLLFDRRQMRPKARPSPP